MLRHACLRRSVRPGIELLEDRCVPTLFPAQFPLSSLDGRNGFALNGVANLDNTGYAVAGLGDVNGDGFDDVLVGAQLSDVSGDMSGQAFVVFGSVVGFPPDVPLSALNGHNGFSLNGVAAGDRAGFAVAGLGDVNGDGFDDLLLGAPMANANGNDSGQAYVVFGASSFAAALDLSDLNGSNGFTLTGIDTDDFAGRAVGGLGDVNGDGLDDLIVGARSAYGGAAGSGQAYVVFGASSFAATLELSSLNGSNGFTMNGIGLDNGAGSSVAGLGDVNDDGLDDLLVGAPFASGGGSNRGEAYVVFGTSSFAATLDLSDLNGTNGFTLNGVANDDNAGYAVAGLGDVNGDGLPDLLVGAPGGQSGGTDIGEAYVVFGANSFAASLDLSSLNGSNGFTLNGVADGDEAGSAVAGLGDVNGDGLADLIVGAPYAAAGGTDRGQAYVVFGASSFAAALALSSLNGSNGFALNGIANDDQAGLAVAGLGDVNGDGLDDLLVGAPLAGADKTGQTYVVFGRTPNIVAVGPGPGSGAQVKVFTSQGGLLANILPYLITFTGGVCVAVGDVTGDGIADVVMTPGAGLFTLVQVWDGATQRLLEFSGGQGFLAYGPNYLKGASVAVGDTDDDGVDEIVVSPNKGPNKPIKVFNGNSTFVTQFFPYGSGFKGGVRVAVGNTEGTTAAEIVTVKSSGSPTLRVFRGTGTQLHQFNVVGNFVAVGNVDNNLNPDEIIVGSNSGQNGRVRIYNSTTGVLESAVTPYAANFQGGVRVGVLQSEGQVNLLTGPGKGTPALVNVFDGLSTPLLDSFFAYGMDFSGGIFVAGS